MGGGGGREEKGKIRKRFECRRRFWGGKEKPQQKRSNGEGATRSGEGGGREGARVSQVNFFYR